MEGFLLVSDSCPFCSTVEASTAGLVSSLSTTGKPIEGIGLTLLLLEDARFGNIFGCEVGAIGDDGMDEEESERFLKIKSVFQVGSRFFKHDTCYVTYTYRYFSK